MAFVLDLLEKADLYYERSHYTTRIEGQWSEISPLISAFYEQAQEQCPPGYLRIALR